MSASQESQQSERDENRCWILLIGEDPDELRSLRQQIEDCGYVCWTSFANNAFLVLEENNRFRVIVADLRIAELTGPELARSIRERYRDTRPWLQFIFVAEQITLVDALDVLQVRSADIVTRPLDQVSLQHAISRANREAMGIHELMLSMQAFREEAKRMASQLYRFAEPNRPMPDNVVEERERGFMLEGVEISSDPEALKGFLEAIIKTRVARSKEFPNKPLADPGWQMVLELCMARMTGRKISVTSLCIASGLPQTTALRRIEQLIELGVFIRTEDHADHRRDFVHLSERSYERLIHWMAVAKQVADAWRSNLSEVK